MQHKSEPTDVQKDKAALWLAKKAGGSLSPEDEARLEHWLNEAPGNRLAYDQLRVLWAQLEAPATRLAQTRQPLWRRFRIPSLRGGLALAGSALALWAVVWLTAPNIVQDWQADIVAGRDVVTVTALPDGSKVHLSAGSALATDFEAGQRVVTLLRGRAYFDVQNRGNTPFIVHGEKARIKVVGTRFQVGRGDNKTVVSVDEGAVDVTGLATTHTNRLSPGQAITVRDGQPGPVETVDPARSLAWMTGHVNVTDMPIGDLAAAFERHVPGRIVVMEPLASRKISGSFTAHDIPASLNTAAAATGSNVLHTSSWLTILY